MLLVWTCICLSLKLINRSTGKQNSIPKEAVKCNNYQYTVYFNNKFENGSADIKYNGEYNLLLRTLYKKQNIFQNLTFTVNLN